MGVYDVLPTLTESGDEPGSSDKFRLDLHLHLHYWSIRLFPGRPFILSSNQSYQLPEDIKPSFEQVSGRGLLVQESVRAALEIVDLCQLLHQRIGLARASYSTEFTSCRAAVLVLLARSLNDESPAIRNALSRGLHIVKIMSLGGGLATSESRVIEALEDAVKRLEASQAPSISVEAPDADGGTEYDRFKEWEMLWKKTASSDHPSVTASTPSKSAAETVSMAERPPAQIDEFLDFPQLFSTELDATFGAFPQELNTFNTIPNFDLGTTQLLEDY